jgi:hypothetical protein
LYTGPARANPLTWHAVTCGGIETASGSVTRSVKIVTFNNSSLGVVQLEMLGSSYIATVRSSPSSMPRPPSPDIETTCRPGQASCAPMACGSALAIEPCRKEPMTRRRPLGVM